MNPEQKVPGEPMFKAPFESPIQNAPTVMQGGAPSLSAPPDNDGKNKLMLIVMAAVVGLLILVILILIVVSSSKKTTQQNAGGNSSQSQELGPATSTSVQQTSDSISNDISSLNDDEDFPANKLSDTALNL